MLPDAADAVCLGEKKSATRLVIDGELPEAEAEEEAASEAGWEEEPKIRSVEQPANNEANVSAAMTPPQRVRRRFCSVLLIPISQAVPDKPLFTRRFIAIKPWHP